MLKEIRAEIQELLLHSVFGITQIFQTNAKESKKKRIAWEEMSGRNGMGVCGKRN